LGFLGPGNFHRRKNAFLRQKRSRESVDQIVSKKGKGSQWARGFKKKKRNFLVWEKVILRMGTERQPESSPTSEEKRTTKPTRVVKINTSLLRRSKSKGGGGRRGGKRDKRNTRCWLRSIAKRKAKSRAFHAKNCL